MGFRSSDVVVVLVFLETLVGSCVVGDVVVVVVVVVTTKNEVNDPGNYFKYYFIEHSS